MALAVGCAVIVGAVFYVRTRDNLQPAELAAMLPPGQGTIAFLDLKTIRAAGLMDQVSGQKVVEEADYRSFVEQSGFDYRQDLDAVAVTFQGEQVFSVLRGRFDWKNLIGYASKQGGQCVNSFCRIPSSRAGRFLSFYPVRSGVMALAVSSSDWAAGVISEHNVPKPAPPVPAQPVWISTSGTVLRNAGMAVPTGTVQFVKALEPAEKIVLALGPEEQRFQVTMDATCSDPQQAAALLLEMEGITSLLRKLIASEKRTPNPKDLSGVLTSGSFRKEDRRVFGHWPVERAVLDAIGGGL